MNKANPIHKQIMEQLVAPAIAEIPKPCRGWILEYDQLTNRANVEVLDQNSDARIKHYHVPVMNIAGLSRSGPFYGQEVLVLYLGHHTNPIILADVDVTHSANTRQNHHTHRRKGGWLPDSICERTEF